MLARIGRSSASIAGRWAHLGLLAIAAIVAGAPASWAAAAASNAPSPALQSLIDGARKEGQLVFVWAEDTFGGSAAVPRWEAEFNKLYGLNVEFRYTPGLTIPELENTLVQENSAGRPATSDLLLGTEAEVAAAIAADLLVPVDWASWATNIDPVMLSDPKGQAVQVSTTIPAILYNADKVTGSTIPKSLADLLQPQYKGRIASTPYAAYFDLVGSKDIWGEQRTTTYLTRLSQQVAGLIRNSDAGRVASGEFDIFALTSNYYAPMWKARGATVEAVIPSDAAILDYKYLGVPKNAAHPNAAKLFINYVLSREGQDVLYDTSFSDLHLVKGSKAAPLVDALKAQGVKFTEVNVAWVLRNDQSEQMRLRALFSKILSRK